MRHPGQCTRPQPTEDTSISSPFLPCLAALALAASAIPAVKRLAWRFDLVDRPNAGAHKSHQRPTPYGGGIAIFAVAAAVLWFSATWLAPIPADGSPLLVLGLCAAALFLLGLIDDWRTLPPLPRLAAQLAAAATLVALCPPFRLVLFGPAVDAALSILWLVAMTNAFNFLDNMDGLAAGIGTIALLLLGSIGLVAGNPPLALIALVLAGATLGFLGYNFPPASIFMGDAGGFLLGFIAAALSLWASNHLLQHVPFPLAALTLLAVPAYDQLSVILIRLRRKAPPWHGDHNHISHRLVRLGLSRRSAVLVIYALTLATGTPALAVYAGAPTLLLALPFVIITLAACLDFTHRHRSLPNHPRDP